MSEKDKNILGDFGETDTIVRDKNQPKVPKKYSVVLLNDDYTPMEFVIYILQNIFNKSHEESTNIMLHVHQKGIGICGVYSFEIAESKANQVIELARTNEHPLQCKIKKA